MLHRAAGNSLRAAAGSAIVIRATPAPVAVEKLHREFLLKSTDLFAYSRPTDAEVLSGEGETARTCHGMEGAEPLIVLIHMRRLDKRVSVQVASFSAG